MLDPRLLRAFVAIAETSSFTQAADRLNMTQSTISQQLGRLEQTVGRDLIDRTARPIQPTASGERLLQHEAETLLLNPAGTASIRIGLPEDIVTNEMAKKFANFAKQHREVRLDVVTGLSRDLMKRYRSGEFDIVVIKESAPGPDHLATFPEELSWFESAATTEPWPDPIPLVTFPHGGLYRDAMFNRIECEQCRWYVSFSGSNLHDILVATEAGLGLTLLPVGTTQGRNLREYTGFGKEPPMVVSVYAWEKNNAVSDLVCSMSAILAERFRAPGESPA